MCFLPFLNFLVLVLLRRRLLISLFLVVHFLVPNVTPFFIFLLPNAIFISIYRCLVAIRPPPLLSLSDPSDRFFGRLYGRRPFRRSASLFGHFGYSGRLSHVDRRDCFAALAIPAPSFLAATILAAIRPIRPLLFLAASATNFDHRLAATTIYFALCPLGSTHLDCLHLFWPLPGHCGHSSATLVARSIVDAIRLFSSPSSPALFPYSITVFVCVSISRTTLFYTFVFPYLIPRLCLAYCERHLPHIVDSISRTLSSSLLDISHLRCRHASFFYFFSKGGRP